MENYSSLDVFHRTQLWKVLSHLFTLDLPCKGGQTHLSVSSTARTQIPRYADIYTYLHALMCICFLLYINRIVLLPHFLQRKCGLSPRKATSVLWALGGARCPALPEQPANPSSTQKRFTLLLKQGNCKSTLPKKNPDRHKNIYTRIWIIYHTTPIKVISKARQPLPLLFESVCVFLKYRFVRKQHGTEKSRPHFRVLSDRKCAHNHEVIVWSSHNIKQSEVRLPSVSHIHSWRNDSGN